MRNHVLNEEERKAAARYRELFDRAPRPAPQDHAEMSLILIKTGLAESELRGLEAA